MRPTARGEEPGFGGEEVVDPGVMGICVQGTRVRPVRKGKIRNQPGEVVRSFIVCEELQWSLLTQGSNISINCTPDIQHTGNTGTTGTQVQLAGMFRDRCCWQPTVQVGVTKRDSHPLTSHPGKIKI
jgi:hypothetical protein